MTRFDAHDSQPSRAAELRTAILATIAGHWGAILATLFVTSLVLLAATALLHLTACVPKALREAFTASPILVFVSPNTSQVEVEALGTRLKALQMVADASLRPKDVALAALVQGGFPAASEGRNPLPDVWIVRLRLDGSPRGDPDFVTLAVSARDAIASQPAVEQVKFDDRWVNLLARSARQWSSLAVPLVAGGLSLAALAIFCLYGLFVRGARASGASRARPTKYALAIVEMLMILVGGMLVYCAWAAIIHSLAASNATLLQPIVDEMGLTLSGTMVESSLAALLVAWLGLAFSSFTE